MNGGKIMEPLAIEYKTADGKRICLEVSIEVKELLEQSDRHFRSQRRQDRRRHTEYVDGLTDIATHLPQADLADLIEKMDNYKRLYAAIETLSGIQRIRVHLYYFRGLTYRSIAGLADVGHKSVIRSVAQARRKLLSILLE
jgi:RNA polymerase sigma-70 factor (ECF subfamily)